jgi:hypothetical protein
MTTPFSKLTSLAIMAATLLSLTAQAQRDRPGRGTGPLAPEAREALVEALAGPEGEYAAHALYSAIIAKFGTVQPYVRIREAESRHIAALERQLKRYGVPLPTNAFAGVVKAPASLLVAAEEGVLAEEKNVALYDRLLDRAKAHPDVTRVLGNLQRASRDKHLPAFKAAAERERGARSADASDLDAEQFLAQFGTAGPEELSRAGKAAQAMRAGNHALALGVLQKLLQDGELKPQQKELVTRAMEQAQAKVKQQP